MKKQIVIIAVIASAVSSYALSLSHAEITNMVDKIKQQRTGIELEHLANTPNPFNINKIEEKVAEAPVEEVAFREVAYSLTAIFNRAAFINGKWYKSGEKVDNYTVSRIGKESVVLVDGSKRKILRLPKKRSIIKFKGR